MPFSGDLERRGAGSSVTMFMGFGSLAEGESSDVVPWLGLEACRVPCHC